MGTALVQVDAFTDTPFRGNPAAVCLLAQARDAAWMQAVAREMNLAETAFLEPFAQGFRLRWFTPTVEVDLCGHATLASTHVLDAPACFHTRSGPLTCAPAGDGWIEMDFPALEPTVAAADDRLLRAIGTTDVYTVATSRFDLLVDRRLRVGHQLRVLARQQERRRRLAIHCHV
jgi:predicted PhzF superfamily epimerase YddE/YHI9